MQQGQHYIQLLSDEQHDRSVKQINLWRWRAGIMQKKKKDVKLKTSICALKMWATWQTCHQISLYISTNCVSHRRQTRSNVLVEPGREMRSLDQITVGNWPRRGRCHSRQWWRCVSRSSSPTGRPLRSATENNTSDTPVLFFLIYLFLHTGKNLILSPVIATSS